MVFIELVSSHSAQRQIPVIFLHYFMQTQGISGATPLTPYVFPAYFSLHSPIQWTLNVHQGISSHPPLLPNFQRWGWTFSVHPLRATFIVIRHRLSFVERPQISQIDALHSTVIYRKVINGFLWSGGLCFNPGAIMQPIFSFHDHLKFMELHFSSPRSIVTCQGSCA